MAVGSRWMWWCTHQFYFVKLLNLPHGGHENVEVIKETQTYTHTHTHKRLLLPSSTNHYNLVYAISPRVISVLQHCGLSVYLFVY